MAVSRFSKAVLIFEETFMSPTETVIVIVIIAATAASVFCFIRRGQQS
jgi:hypothetical protein